MSNKLVMWFVFFGIGLGVGILDLWTKEITFEALDVEVDMQGERPVLKNKNGLIDPITGGPYQERIVVIQNYFELEATINYGAFNGWFASFTTYLAFISLVALVVIAAFLFFASRRIEKTSAWLVIALGLLWAGTFGNFYDRYFIGGVRDFIKWFVLWDGKPKVWPNFNIADSAICVGVGIIILIELINIFKKSQSADAPEC